MTQYHFTSWPDHGVPKVTTTLLTFIRQVQKEHNKELGVPLLVHCSAGVGRTGTFITLDAMLERILSEDSVNVYEFVKEMRQKRVLMVQTLVINTCMILMILELECFFYFFLLDTICFYS